MGWLFSGDSCNKKDIFSGICAQNSSMWMCTGRKIHPYFAPPLPLVNFSILYPDSLSFSQPPSKLVQTYQHAFLSLQVFHVLGSKDLWQQPAWAHVCTGVFNYPPGTRRTLTILFSFFFFCLQDFAGFAMWQLFPGKWKRSHDFLGEK